MLRSSASYASVVADGVTGHPLAGVASPELEEVAAVEDGLLFATESCGVWSYVPADPRVLAVHRKLGRSVQLVAVKRAAAHGSAA